MGALTNIFVDPFINADSGSGTVGDPYGDLQWALNQVTRDSSNGDRFNIKAGTDEVLTGPLSLASYGSPTGIAPLEFRGYTSAAQDGGIGTIDGGGNAVINASSTNSIVWRDLHMFNNSTGGADMIDLNDFIQVINCEFSDILDNAIFVRDYCDVIGCHFRDIGIDGVRANSGSVVGCYFRDSGAKEMTNAINLTQINRPMAAIGNVISFTGSGRGIRMDARNSGSDEVHQISHNSLKTTGSTPGNGIYIERDLGAGAQPGGVFNNLIEGFDIGINLSEATTRSITMVAGNSEFNCTTAFSLGDLQTSLFDNESLSASPYAQSGADTFANRRSFFQPTNEGNVLSPFGGMAGARGAIQGSFMSQGGGRLVGPGGVPV